MVELNDVDVAFATHMIPHHQQAVELAELAETRAVVHTDDARAVVELPGLGAVLRALRRARCHLRP